MTGNTDIEDTRGRRRLRPSSEVRIPVDPRLIEDEPSDGGEYEPSNEDDRVSQTEAEAALPSGSETIDAFDFVRRDHPLRPLRKSCTLSNPSQLYSLRNHRDFWWDVLLAMNKQAKTNMDQEADQTIRNEVIRLAEENRELRREKDRAVADKTFAERKADELERKLELAQRGRERDQTIIAHLGSQPRTTRIRPDNDDDPESPQQRDEFMSIRDETTRRTVPRFTSTSLELHNNPKFPDAPVFSGDRRAFDAWKDKIRDKLDNSAAQYPTEQQRIQYIRSRTEGSAYEQIRAQSRPEHPRSFLTAEEMLQALEKIYGDRNKRTRAINELRTLRMGRKTFDDFYADFARCAAEIGYADDAMIPLLENANSDELARQVIGLRKPSDYFDLVDFYREIDHQMRDYDRRTANRFRSPRMTPAPEQARYKPQTQTPAVKKEGYFPTSEDRALLSQHGRCYKCGQHGHRIGGCTNPQMKEMPRLFARVANKLNEAIVDTDDESTVVEGKDES
ncbi:hypothetical protein H634G_10853 [Metarhizium anisopliae BRIP 53293]|uniref:CCHC-type domain-containing protein n=1 Tax=Metarhizium anisopliae BRIP 53293 TaxID=1291518 RepID=A0A0D9NII2_METAN|nr:hypothetical protein H634G_10853 [Metarhizium anisopliae BRIP 53293]